MKREMKVILGWALLITIVSFLLSSCTTQRKVNNYLLEHPDYSSQICAQLYPVQATDSKSDISVSEQYKAADNADYSQMIDSLFRQSYELTEALNASQLELEYLKQHAPDTCKYLVDVYEKENSKLKGQVSVLSGKVNALQKAYKPCEPDTVLKTITKTITNTVVSTAEKKQIEELGKKLAVSEGKASVRLWWGLIATVVAVLLLIVLIKK